MKKPFTKSPLAVMLLLIVACGYVATSSGQSASVPTVTVTLRGPGTQERTNKTPKFDIKIEHSDADRVELTFVTDSGVKASKFHAVTTGEDLENVGFEADAFTESVKGTVVADLFKGSDALDVSSVPLPISIDMTGPKIATSLRTEWTKPAPEGELILHVEFDENVKPAGDDSSFGANFQLDGESQFGVFEAKIDSVDAGTATFNGKRVTLNLGSLVRANYQLTVKSELTDDLGNPNTKPLIAQFPVTPSVTIGRPEIKIPSLSKTTGDGVKLTNNSSVALEVSGVPDREGRVDFFVNGARQFAIEDVSSPITQTVKLTKHGLNSISVSYSDKTTGKTHASVPVNVVLDDVGPLLQHVELVESPSKTGTEMTLLATFASDDFKDVAKESFKIQRRGAAGELIGDVVDPDNAVVEGRTIRLGFQSPLPAGEYELKVIGRDTSPLTDVVENRAGREGPTYPGGRNQTAVFSVLAERQFGQHVEFTPYAPPKEQLIPEEGFNPGDFVETRVARLFYFRDAHRVAQIINRNIRSFNQAAVTQAERRAERSRDDADEATDDRRQKERAAVRAAEKARNAEQQLADAQQTLAEVQRLSNTTTSYTNQKTALEAQLTAPPEPADPADPLDPVNQRRAELKKQIAFLDTQIFQNNAAKDSIGVADESQLEKQVANMQQSVANLRESELNARDVWNDAQAKEERAAAAQFRDEVTAAETDPDTYVAGDIHSEDPVTQCSISVIGEGLIQLRGPIKGINKIRTMINQIDSPVGQIKIGIFTVQVNGEEGDKMEKVVGDAEGNIDLSRFLVNQSLNLLRRAIQSEAAIIAESCELNGHYQVDRDRRYLYGFFGRDFIDELYEMNSEFMFTENKLLSLHSMDTVSFNRAMFILALAKNDVRERIVTRFLESVKTELPDAEFDFRRSSELKPHRTQKKFPPWNLTHLPIKNHYHKEQEIHEAVHRNALQRYHFRNFSGFFDTGFVNPDTMNPMQREFVRLAQIFKARLVAEMELKQRVLERGLIEDRSNDENQKAEIMREVHTEALKLSRDAYLSLLAADKNLKDATEIVDQVVLVIADLDRLANSTYLSKKFTKQLLIDVSNAPEDDKGNVLFTFKDSSYNLTKTWIKIRDALKAAPWATNVDESYIDTLTIEGSVSLEDLKSAIERNDVPSVSDWVVLVLGFSETDLLARVATVRADWNTIAQEVHALIGYFRAGGGDAQNATADSAYVYNAYRRTMNAIDAAGPSDAASRLRQTLTEAFNAYGAAQGAELSIQRADGLVKRTRVDLDHRKLLNHLIDEQEDKFIELVEGTRSHIAVIDQYLKRLSIAIEDDFKVQFYDPAFVRVREAARGRSVNLSQVERTTILTNNRDFAKVDPQATMEFDLPKRQIAIKEAFDAAKALVEDTGALVNDPTFLSAFQMMGGATQPSTVKNLIPGQSQSLDQHNLGHVPPQPQSSPGSALQSLVPEPSIFKLETGTGFQIRPVMQPDGDSAVYDFDYMYTTNIREPVRADEKHIGRIKRHFVHTAVQTGNFELREISRYQVALKVSRTSRGVPLLEDIPVLGAAFRPAPSDESSLQQNIIFGQTNIYPTLFDLMGLRWAQQVVDLDHASLLESEHVIRGRQKSMRDYVFGVASKRVDEFLDVQKQTPSNYRPDFYHQQTLPSPHHPGGYVYPGGVKDPRGMGFERFDRRPPEMQEPPYDRFRHQPIHPERVGPHIEPQRTQHVDPSVVPLSHSNSNLQPLPNSDLEQFQSLLLQGPRGSVEKSHQPRLNEGASSVRPRPSRMPSVQGSRLPPSTTLQHAGSSGMLQTSHTLPQLRQTPTRTHRGAFPGPNSTVVPAGFEQAIGARPTARASRLPAVNNAQRRWSNQPQRANETPW